MFETCIRGASLFRIHWQIFPLCENKSTHKLIIVNINPCFLGTPWYSSWLSHCLICVVYFGWKFTVNVMAELALGTKFTSAKDAILCVNRYNETNFTNFVVRSRTNRALLYRCRHGIQRASQCKGVRPNQHYNFVGCEAAIRMYISKTGSVKVSASIWSRQFKQWRNWFSQNA